MKINIIYTSHARRRMSRRNFSELDVENAIHLGKKTKLHDEPNKFAFKYKAGKRKYEAICFAPGNVYKVKTLYPL